MKKIFLILIVGAAIVGGFYIFNEKPDKSELEKMGFTKDEYNDLSARFDDKSLAIISSINDKNIISEFINNKDLIDDKIDDYINYYNENKDINISSVILMVNNDLDKIDDLEYDDIILDLLDDKYFIKENIHRYISYYHQNSTLDPASIIVNVNSNIDYEFYTHTQSADLTYDNLVLVNKFFYLDKDYEPVDLVAIESGYTSWGGYLRKPAYDAFKIMVDAAYGDGINLYSISPYRNYNVQNNLYEGYASSDGYAKADTYSARPGYSEHQTGLAVDINSVDDSFAYTKEAKWLADNAYKYGFVLRYPKGKEYITGYQYEPWHYRYVGEEVSKKMHELDITFEEYYAYFIK